MQEEDDTGVILSPPVSAVLAVIFIARSIRPFVSPVEHQVEFLRTHESIEAITFLQRRFGHTVRKNPRKSDSTEILTHVQTRAGCEITC